jgi:hypothetical protein
MLKTLLFFGMSLFCFLGALVWASEAIGMSPLSLPAVARGLLALLCISASVLWAIDGITEYKIR